jgi:hypothetical protein
MIFVCRIVDIGVTAKAGRVLNRIGTARRDTVRRGKTQWKLIEGRALHRPGSAQFVSVFVGHFFSSYRLPILFSVPLTIVRFQVLTAANMKMTVFWNIAPCSLVQDSHLHVFI